MGEVERGVLEAVRETLADDECERSVDDLMDELRDDSLGILDFSFKCEKRFGISLNLPQLFALETTAEGVAAEALADLKQRFPFLRVEALPPTPQIDDLRSLLTFEAAVALVQDALQRQSAAGRQVKTSSGDSSGEPSALPS